jgi:hypothetical protein
MILKKIKLNYNLSLFLDSDYSIHNGSCISYQKKEQQDIHNTSGGFPKTYHKDNTRIQQLWYDDNEVDYAELGKQLNMEVITVSSILQPPGNVITVHRDTFFQMNKKYPNDTRTKVRANIYLEEWKIGHIIQYRDTDGEWKNSTHWSAGEGFLWDSDVLHVSGNIGLKPKFTLQVSGFLFDN